ncbi:RagB/SusD family nutrient uptake outer membrane protein [Sphingobacterium sp. DN00404]|uniref:RagB/SusD family nutrient uptake outer membrane protein n=1 Tax=Sphingobacterium micropteri TaxID=2763501 RepID=A0ABR7YNZ1_9SPHI|nr:RagB/SusD family nutrient uptake outer membrane protein [Sphingobacterium micropteri]MBD1432898.1 RagB/SusD family nutrient uptake outer membrane protein [Sphingobacterium micropteri]
MRSLIKIVLTIMVSISLYGCQKYLDVVPDNIATMDDAYKDRVSAQRALATCYNQIPRNGTRYDPGFAAGDDLWIHQFIDGGAQERWRQYYRELAINGNNVTRPLYSYWHNIEGGSALWKAIRDCNTFIANVHNARDLDSYEREKWIAEVKTLKAYYHFYLMQLYGPIPIARENIPATAPSEELMVYREPIDEVVAYIVQLLDEAIPNLDLEVDNTVSDAGRITKPVAAAIKTKVLVTAASPFFNGNQDYASMIDKRGIVLFNPVEDPNKWTLAAEAAQEAIDIAHEAGIRLYHHQTTFNVSNETLGVIQVGQIVADKFNEERIWSLSDFNSSSPNLQDLGLELRTIPRLHSDHQNIVYQWFIPTLKMAELFYSKNGVPIEEDVDYAYEDRMTLTFVPQDQEAYMQPGYRTIGLHLDREPRFYGSLGVDGGWWFGLGRTDENAQWPLNLRAKSMTGGMIGNQRYSTTGYYIKKLSNYRSAYTGKDAYVGMRFDFPLFRLADLYLLHAEALNESLSSPDANVYHYIDLIRQRAGLSGVVDSWAQHSRFPQKPTTKEGMREIIHQERNIELAFEGQRFWDLRRWKKSIQYMNQPVRGWNIAGETPPEFYQVITHNRSQYTLRDILWPIMQDEMLRNTNLLQNPGW